MLFDPLYKVNNSFEAVARELMMKGQTEAVICDLQLVVAVEVGRDAGAHFKHTVQRPFSVADQLIGILKVVFLKQVLVEHDKPRNGVSPVAERRETVMPALSPYSRRMMPTSVAQPVWRSGLAYTSARMRQAIPAPSVNHQADMP